jgi:serine/threonine protein kinase
VERKALQLLDHSGDEARAPLCREGETIGHYIIGRELGHGGMGIVYEATDVHPDRIVAIKFLPEEVLRDQAGTARFLTEAKASSMLNHPNIVTIHQFVRDGDTLAVVMERIDGETLRSRLAEGSVSADQAIEYARQLGRPNGSARPRDRSPRYQAGEHHEPA